MTWSLRRVLVVAFGVSLAFSIARVPHATWKKRIGQMRQHESLGDSGYHLGRTWPSAHRVALSLIEKTPADAVVLWRGHWKGPVELLAASIGERLLYDAARVPGDVLRSKRPEVLGRPIATGAVGSESGVLILVANDDVITLEVLP